MIPSDPGDCRFGFMPVRSIIQSLLHEQSVISLAWAMFAGTPISHFGVCSPQTLRVTSAYRHLSGLGARADVPEVSLTDPQVLLYPGFWHVVYEGMAVVNLGIEPERVDAVLLNAVGNEVPRVQLPITWRLQPNKPPKQTLKPPKTQGGGSEKNSYHLSGLGTIRGGR